VTDARPSTDKRALRARLRALRDAVPPQALPVPAAFLALLRPALVVASYAPMGGEADPAPFAQAALAAGARLALPHVVDRATPLRFLAWDGQAHEPGPFGLRNPPAGSPELRPDLILTPLVGFDRSGNRIGQGAGHYDRAFATFPQAIRIGIAWGVQHLPPITPDPWDVPLHAVATEQEWISIMDPTA